MVLAWGECGERPPAESQQLRRDTRFIRYCAPCERVGQCRFSAIIASPVFGDGMHMTNQRRQPKVPSRKAIVRAVASSTAIETGKKVAELEKILRRKSVRFPSLVLAK